MEISEEEILYRANEENITKKDAKELMQLESDIQILEDELESKKFALEDFFQKIFIKKRDKKT